MHTCNHRGTQIKAKQMAHIRHSRMFGKVLFTGTGTRPIRRRPIRISRSQDFQSGWIQTTPSPAQTHSEIDTNTSADRCNNICKVIYMCEWKKIYSESTYTVYVKLQALKLFLLAAVPLNSATHHSLIDFSGFLSADICLTASSEARSIWDWFYVNKFGSDC